MRLSYMAVATLAAAALLTPSLDRASAGEAHATPDNDTASKSIVATAVADGRFKTLAAALTAADLVPTLQGDGPFTVFAPLDSAFAALPDGTVASLLKPENRAALTRVLTHHVVSGKVMSSDLLSAAKAMSLAGTSLPLGLTVGTANIVLADIACRNGVIHVIDTVLLPPAKDTSAASAPSAPAATKTIVETAVADGRFKTLAAALTAAELIPTLQGDGPFTVFAPLDAAFAALPAGTVGSLLKPENRAALTRVLTHHVVSGKVMSKDLLSVSAATSLAGTSLPLGLRVGKGKVILADIQCSNGVIHVVDTVLLPPAETSKKKTATAPSSSKPAAKVSTTKNIIETAVADGRFKTLAAALTAAELIPALQGDGPFTVFAPLDSAFAALPQGTVASLLKPENRAALTRVLTHHVVSGRIMAKDLLPVASATSLANTSLPLGLRVGNANVVLADVVCSNGVIHVIDTVLLPPAAKTVTEPASMRHTQRSSSRMNASPVLRDAIDRGVAIYNAGDHAACAAIYSHAAHMLLREHGKQISDVARMRLSETARSMPASATDQAWAWRRAFDEILADEDFTPRVEASMPPGFPAPGPVGRVVSKTYPAYRAARAEGGNEFFALFQHIKQNKVEMTAPVEMTLGDDLRERDMAFLYEGPNQGQTGMQGRVQVLDEASEQVLSLGMRGTRNAESLAMAKRLVEKRLGEAGLRRSGDWRVLGYNSPMVPSSKQYWELQVPVVQ